MPTKTTIMRWLHRHEDFCDQYVRAHETRKLVDAEDIETLADDASHDWIERETKDGTKIKELDREHIERVRLKIDTRKWLMTKLAPKHFGKTVAVTGKNGGPVKHEVATVGDVLDEVDGAGTGLPDDAGGH